MNILFYSRECQSSQNLILLMKNIGVLNKFKSYCVDDNLDNLPPHITAVPTLIIKGLPEALVKNKAFEWLESVKYIKQSQIADNNRKMILMNMAKQAQLSGPCGYTSSEMSGVSDSFAFTNIDMAQPHAFSSCGDDQSNIIFTAPEEKDGMKEDEQKRRIAEYNLSLDKQNNEHSLFMKKEQLRNVIIAEQRKLNEQNN